MAAVLTVKESKGPYCFTKELNLGSRKGLAGVVAKLEAAERTERWGLDH